MKTLLLLLLAVSARATTTLQTQDVGVSSITHSGTETYTSNSTVLSNNTIHGRVCTNNFTASTIQTSFKVGFATVTVTTTITEKLRVTYTGQIFNDTSTRFAAASFLLNGGYDTGLGATVPITSSIANDDNIGATFDWTTTAQSPGTYNITFTLAANAGTAKACASVPAEDTFSAGACQFCVEEVK